MAFLAFGFIGMLSVCTGCDSDLTSILQNLNLVDNQTPRSTVIWSFVGSRDESESLATALRSQLITHVAIFAGNRFTSDALDSTHTVEAIAIAKEAGVKLILVRNIWRSKPDPDYGLSVLTDVDFYVREMELLREEANRVGADYVAFDTEAYGITSLSEYFRMPGGFVEEDFDAVVGTINQVIGLTGQVDFVLPAGSNKNFHPYRAIAGLGKQRISEHTYYDNEEITDSITYPFEIAGMYVNVTKENKNRHWLAYYLPEEVFGDKAHIWKQRNGLMIWPREYYAAEVARELVIFAAQCSRDPNCQ